MSGNYNPNKHGWGFAAVVCLIAAGLFFTARTIHQRTYRHPRDPMNEQVYRQRDIEKNRAASADHAAPAAASSAAEHAAPAEKH
ncbi:MAG: hypothetical protein ABJC26_09550 [Gemmatimonadaceae bacterium]